MSSFFYNLGKLAGPKARKAKWAWTALAGAEAEATEAEQAVGKDLARSVRSRCSVCKDTETVEIVQNTGAKLVGHLNDRQREFTFICIETSNPEAFCLPGGYIYISRALLNLCAEDRSQLAFVLAHEMAHILQGHVMERMACNTLFHMASRARVVHTVSGGLENLGVEFLSKVYSRDQELSADRSARDLLQSAGFAPSSAIALLSRLEALEQKRLLGSCFSTHPKCSERISQLRQAT